jgi:diguanylate cyclase (GGDEF)-like protein
MTAAVVLTPPLAPRSTRRIKVLLVDDERIARTMVAGWLGEWGYDVVVATTGEQALTLLDGDPEIEVVLLDWVLPGMSGIDVCRRIRETGREPYVYVLMLTGRTNDANVVEGLQAGADDYVVKPCNPLELHQRVRAGERVVELQRQLIDARERLRHEALHDALTGLPNRANVMARLTEELARAGRAGKSTCVIMSDLDKFKSINDTYGHPAGDAVLREAARRMRCAIRAYDVLARFGGEEFVYLGPECPTKDGPTVGERLRRMLAIAPVNWADHKIPISGSFGIACTEQSPHATPALLLGAADAALYRAKRNGRNRVELATEEDWAAAATAPQKK